MANYAPSDQPQADEAEQTPTTSETWHQFKDETTAHCIPHIGGKGCTKNIFWGLVTCAASAILLYQAICITRDYLRHDVSVSIRISHEKELVFPAVTVCNMSPLRKSAFVYSAKKEQEQEAKEDEQKEQVLEVDQPTTGQPTEQLPEQQLETDQPRYSNNSQIEHTFRRRKRVAPTDPYSTTTPMTAQEAEVETGSCCCSCCFPTDSEQDGCDLCKTQSPQQCALADTFADTDANTTDVNDVVNTQPPIKVKGSRFPERLETRKEFRKEEMLTESIAEQNDEEKRMLGTQARQLIIDCQYAGHSCFLRDFERYYNPTHGNCFVFNSGWKNPQLYQSRKSGRRHGLSLMLNIDQDQYMRHSGDTAGARIVINSQSRMSFPEDEGMTISPGQATSVGMKQVVISRLWDCMKAERGHKDINVFEELYPVNYSSMACSKTCYQSHVLKRCQCGDAFYPMTTGKAFGYKQYKACRTDNITQDDCKYAVMREFNQNKLNCDCPTACTDDIFELSVSSGQWPSDVERDDILKRFKSKIINIVSNPMDPEKYKRNLAKLTIYFEEFNVERITEQAAYSLTKYLSDMGGTLGLFFGCSLFTILEFVAFFVRLLCNPITRRCRSKRDQVEPAED